MWKIHLTTHREYLDNVPLRLWAELIAIHGGNMKKLFHCMVIALAMFIAFPVFADDKVNVNTAAVEELQHVHGIGAKLAESIVQDRKANGPYASLDEMKRVKGIGEKNLEKLKGELTLGE